MKHKWQVKREIVAYPDGQRRWDKAYLCLLRWAHEREVTRISQKQEVSHESSSLCPRFDPQTSRNPDD
jgi:hypothetical protein